MPKFEQETEPLREKDTINQGVGGYDSQTIETLPTAS